VTPTEGGATQAGEIDKALKPWRQGDCVVGEQWFVHRFAPTEPLTPESVELADGELDLVEVPVRGLVLLSQSCDVVRSAHQSPFLEVAPLVMVSE